MGVLAGRTALVTGASRGIGRGIAERLARDGARVAVHYGRNEAAAKETVAAIEAAGGSAFAIGVELGLPGDAQATQDGAAWAASISALGRVGTPADVADVVAFLASDAGRWVTGSWVDATGGSLA
ncbi:SDR family oxidoreductase [Streptomyces sp. NPDC051104]|uniref:SDR family oxidoreductase n=1 Tax=Streptomyces sp. NPDC051104 TaxID=3155044 RepID=UPI0034406274